MTNEATSLDMSRTTEEAASHASFFLYNIGVLTEEFDKSLLLLRRLLSRNGWHVRASDLT